MSSKVNLRNATSQDEGLGEGFWGDYGRIKGEVNLYQIKKAVSENINRLQAQRIPTFATGVVVEPYDPGMIRKAILDPTYGLAGFASDMAESRKSFVEGLNTIRKASLKQAGFQEDQIKKAADSSSNLLHTIYDQDIVELYRRPLPVQALIGKEPNMGAVALWDAIPAGGAGSAAFGPEDPNLVESDITTGRRQADIKIGWTTAAVTQFAQFAGQAQVPTRDLMSIQMLTHTERLKQLRERRTLGVFSGYTENPTFAPAGEYEYQGLYQLIHNNTGSPNYISCDAGVNTWEELEPLIDESNNKMLQDGLVPNVAITDLKTFGIIKRGLEPYVRYQQNADQTWGIQKIMLNLVGSDGPVPVIPHQYLPTTAGQNGSFFLLDLNYIKYRVLYPEIFTELAQAVNPTKRFTISFAENIIDKSDYDGTSSLQGGVFGIQVS